MLRSGVGKNNWACLRSKSIFDEDFKKMPRILIFSLITFAVLYFFGKFGRWFIRHAKDHRKHQKNLTGQKIKHTDIAAYIVKRETQSKDQWKCIKCGSTENLQYDHINSVAKPGNNTPEEIELLCIKCLKKK